MLPFKLVYHPEYELKLNGHVFPWQKYRLVHDSLLEKGLAEPADFLQPEPATEEDLLRVHTSAWVQALEHGTVQGSDSGRLEIPYSPQVVRAFWLAVGGTTLAARLALRDGIGFHIGGGFHHAFRDHGEGFCAVHDAAVAIRRLQGEGLLGRVMVVDCDVHQGNGTASIFAGDRTVFTLSIHQFRNYPSDKPPSDIDIDLEDGTGNENYLTRLCQAYVPALARFRPQLVVYLAGADPFCRDQLGGLCLTMEGLKARDQIVLGAALMERVPVAVTLAGGYALRVADTVAIHVNTAEAARQALESSGWKR